MFEVSPFPIDQLMVPSSWALPPTPGQIIKNSFLHFRSYNEKGGMRRRSSSCPPGIIPNTLADASNTIPTEIHTPVALSDCSSTHGSPVSSSLVSCWVREPIGPEIPEFTTTLMIRNLPTRYSPISLIRVFEDCGFANTFDFFYCPIDFKTSKNQGYCFINFIHSSYANMFGNIFHGTRLGITTSTKILDVSASRRQGLRENVALFRGSDLLSSFSLPYYKPFVYMFGDLLPLSESLFEIIMSSDE